METNINELRNLLKRANDAYREGRPFLSDKEYDGMEETLRRYSPDDEWFLKGVNDEIPSDRKMKLPYPMMSLDKVKTIDAIKEWASKFPSNVTYIISPKFDGLSVGYQGKKHWTRGNGIIGQDCTEHMVHVSKYAKHAEEAVVRGEIIFDNEAWNSFKKINPEAVSSRNSATGLVNGDYDPSRIEEYKLLRIMGYEIFNSNLSKEEQMNILSSPYEKIDDVKNFNEDFLLNLYQSWKKKFPIDGLVIDVNEAEYRQGTEANGNPSFAIAYKSPSFNEMGIGVIESIERSVNRNGIITPVINLSEPIFLSGAWISRVTAINMKYVYQWRLYPGETVTIVRSGEVIPKVVAVGDVKIPFKEEFSSSDEYKKAYNAAVLKRNGVTVNVSSFADYNFDKCPSCGSTLVPLKDDKGNWSEMVCTNSNCKEKCLEAICKFFSIADIDGFGDKKISQIAESLIGDDKIVPDFFTVLNVTREHLLRLEGWAETSVDNFLNEMTKIKENLSLARFLHASGWFEELGEKTLQQIIDADGWGTDIEHLIQIENVQEKTAKTFLKGRACYIMAKDAIEENFKFKYTKSIENKVEGRLNGLCVCMTGFRDKTMAEAIKNLGGTVLDSLTKNVNCLVTKDINSGSSKVKKAEKMGIEILDINGFKTRYLEEN